MANSVGSAAKRISRLCFTFVNVTIPMAPRAPLPTKFAVAEKHTARAPPDEDYSYHRKTLSIFTLNVVVHNNLGNLLSLKQQPSASQVLPDVACCSGSKDRRYHQR